MNPHTLDDFRRVQFLLACRYAKAIDALERAAPIDASLVRLRDESRQLIADQVAPWFEVTYACPACGTVYYEYPAQGWCDNCNTKVRAA